MPTARYDPTSATGINGLIYVFGGVNGGYLNTVEAYDPATGKWTTEANMPTAREGAVAVAAPNGLIYVFGGFNGQYLSIVEAYNPLKNTWTTEASMSTARWEAAAALGSDGLIYVFGGISSSALNGSGGNTGGGVDFGGNGQLSFNGTCLLLDDTINGNYASTGGGLAMAFGNVNIQNTIIAGNQVTTASPDFFLMDGPILTSRGGNLVGVNNSGDHAFSQTTDQVGSAANPLNPLLGTLQNNGGPTVGAAGASIALDTEALRPGSPALGKGVANGAPFTDERGFTLTRFVNTDAPDVGAFQTRIVASQVTSTVPGNGNQNPYGLAFVPANFPTGGVLQPGDLLIANFNNADNDQGTGTTITRIDSLGHNSTFFTSALPGLDAALGILQAGFAVVGNVPSVNGTPQAGALQFLDKNGHVLLTLTDATLLDGPWGLTVAKDTGATAELFVANVLSGSITRINLQIQNGTITVLSKTQIQTGFGHRLDNAAFVVGPSGLAYDAANDILYVASSVDNEIFEITSASVGQGVTALVVNDQTHLHGPLGLLLLPNGNLLVANSDAQNVDPNQPSELVEFTTVPQLLLGQTFGKFVTQLSVDANNGGAFGLGLSNTGGQFRLAAVDDNANTVTIWSNVSMPLPDLTLVHTSDPYQVVVDVANPGNNPLTYTATVISQAVDIDKKLGLVFIGSFYQSTLGINGMWLQSTNGSNVAHGGWYFLLPDGTLHQWDGGGTKATASTSPVVATFSPSLYNTPLQLASAGPAATAFSAEQALDLVFTGNFYNSSAGINGDWLRSANNSNSAHGGWYFILPDGSLHQWDGGTSKATATTSPTVATLNATYWQLPSLLYQATAPQGPAGISAAFLGQSNVLQLGGYKNFTGTFGVEVAVNNGTSTTTQDFLVNVTDQAPTLAPVPDQTISHTASLSVTLDGADPDPNETLSYNVQVFTDTTKTEAYLLQQQLALSFTGNYYQSTFGINGMWLRSTNGGNAAHGGWYFLLSDGTLHQWDGGTTKMTSSSSPTVATLDPSYYANPSNLLNATPTLAPAGVTAIIIGNTVVFGNFGAFTGKLFVIASVSDGILSGQTSFRINVT
jgi:hypothetical protein